MITKTLIYIVMFVKQKIFLPVFFVFSEFPVYNKK